MSRGERPAAHFRTSVHASARYAAAMLALLRHADAALGHPARLDLVDIGAGQGELLSQVLRRGRAAAGRADLSRTSAESSAPAARAGPADPLGAGPATGDHRAGHRQRVAGQRARSTRPN